MLRAKKRLVKTWSVCRDREKKLLYTHKNEHLNGWYLQPFIGCLWRLLSRTDRSHLPEPAAFSDRGRNCHKMRTEDVSPV
jgi:hypothetical protein